MALRRLLTFVAIISFAGGLASLLAPAWLWELFGVNLDSGGVFIARRYAAAAGLSFAVIAWLAREGSAETKWTAAYGFLTLLGVSFVVALSAQLDGLMSTAGWIIVLADLTLIAAFAYVFVKERALFGDRTAVNAADQTGEEGRLSRIDSGM